MAEQTRRGSLFQRVGDHSDILEIEFAEVAEEVVSGECKAPALVAAGESEPETPALETPGECEPETAALETAGESELEAKASEPAGNTEIEAQAAEPAGGSESEPAKPSEFELQKSQKAALADAQSERIKTLVTEATNADRQITHLQDRLDAVREELALKENESASLQTSLDLFASDNAHLSELLAVKDVEAEAMRAQLEQLKSTLLWTEDERIKLVAAAEDAVAQHRTERATLEMRAAAEASRTTAAETALAELKRSMLTPTEYSAFQKLIADATLSRNAATRRLDVLESSLQKKEQQVQALEDSQSKLIYGTNSLLETFGARDAALARAELAIKFLVKRIAQLEAEAKVSRGRKEAEQPAIIVRQNPKPPEHASERTGGRPLAKAVAL